MSNPDLMANEDDIEELPPLPVLYDHCLKVYEEMEGRSELITSEEHEMVVYEGHLTTLFRDLRMSIPYYTHVTRELKRMGCIVQLRRGGGNAPSQWELRTAPTATLYRTGFSRKPHKSEVKFRSMEQKIRDLTKRITDLEHVHTSTLHGKAQPNA